ncbi:hypothetical protein SLOPH_886 [Spraguea lophii 42_110]|uniref:Uncharacterized protein n=1 Tax=Spraguea lophii (strain 42_110) TaxID=1358809 RepID=S7W8D5_SPRLO|nr:hypothetical protein SLOPH_886 [Spraguea lophii 42_110]
MEEKINGVRISKGEIYFLESNLDGKEIWKKNNRLNVTVKNRYINEIRKKKDELINMMNKGLEKNQGIRTDLNITSSKSDISSIDVEKIAKFNDIIQINKEEQMLDLFHDDFETEQTEDEDEFLREACKNDKEEVKMTKKTIMTGGYRKHLFNKWDKNKEDGVMEIKTTNEFKNLSIKTQKNPEKKIIDLGDDESSTLDTPVPFIYVKKNKARAFGTRIQSSIINKKYNIKINIKLKKFDPENILFVRDFKKPTNSKNVLISKTIEEIKKPVDIRENDKIGIEKRKHISSIPGKKEENVKRRVTRKETVLKNFFIDDDVELPNSSFFDDLC